MSVFDPRKECWVLVLGFAGRLGFATFAERKATLGDVVVLGGGEFDGYLRCLANSFKKANAKPSVRWTSGSLVARISAQAPPIGATGCWLTFW